MTDPRFSIVVPTYDRPRELAELLERLAALDHPREDFEVVVVDDGGRADLEPVVGKFRMCLDVRLLRAEHRGCAPARQAGTEAARGRWLVFTDDDCLPASDWLSALAERVERSPDAAVGGRVVNALPDNPYSSASQALMSYLYRVYNADHDDACFFTTNNVAMPADVFHSVGGLEREWVISGGEDRDLWQRWRRAGHRLVYAPEAVVAHAHRLTLGKLWRQHYDYGRGAYVYHSGCLSKGRHRVQLEGPSFYVQLPFHAWAEQTGTRAARCAALLVVTQLATVAGWLRERAVRRR
jgi:GT2 family glycosyltransferase